ncbi:glycosyl hydrolase [Marinobacter halodurans]|uniref:Glycosyl hydrolase n=2 Tax=Marinobacter halodurans TaxID=2528979 RepID=A0ABY1ZED2_9GAMM|nr:glycosyl hydrolase [Marinobacter halodurans]
MLDVADTGSRLVAVGERGFILLSDDRGHSWRQVQAPVSVTLTRVAFADAQQGWAVGHAGVILHTVDGGLTWHKQLDGITIANLDLAQAQADFAADPSKRNTRALRGAKRLVADGPDKPLLDIHFFNAQHGIVLGAYGLALETLDGGQHWHSIRDRIDNPYGFHLYKLAELDGKLFICGEQGLLLRSSDNGQHFTALQSPSQGTLFGMLTTKTGGLLAYGLKGVIYLSEDGGDSWQQIENSLPATLTAGRRLHDGSLLLVDEAGRRLLSRDNGHSFQASSLDNPTYLTGLVQTGDSGLVLTSLRGPIHLASSDNNNKEPGQ